MDILHERRKKVSRVLATLPYLKNSINGISIYVDITNALDHVTNQLAHKVIYTRFVYGYTINDTARVLQISRKCVMNYSNMGLDTMADHMDLTA